MISSSLTFCTLQRSCKQITELAPAKIKLVPNPRLELTTRSDNNDIIIYHFQMNHRKNQQIII